jgi:hypothetical protein
MSFANLKKQSGSLDKLTKAIESLNASNDASSNKDNYWKPEIDKAGNGYAIIRFLPAAPDDEDGLPWIKQFNHGFQGPGGWLIDNCLTTKNEKCPVCESNSTLWNSGIEANKQVARDRKRKLSYTANIYIVEDSKHPENNGKVFLYKFGAKIFDKLREAMNPQFDDEKPMNPFDMWKGANFKLKIRKVEGYQNYDKSEFEAAAPLLNDDDELEKIWKSEYSLKQLMNDSEYKSYDELKARLDKVLGTTSSTSTVEDVSEPVRKSSAPTAKAAPSIHEDEDDDLSYFSKLAEED